MEKTQQMEPVQLELPLPEPVPPTIEAKDLDEKPTEEPPDPYWPVPHRGDP